MVTTGRPPAKERVVPTRIFSVPLAWDEESVNLIVVGLLTALVEGG